jgi:hypothetical protein
MRVNQIRPRWQRPSDPRSSPPGLPRIAPEVVEVMRYLELAPFDVQIQPRSHEESALLNKLSETAARRVDGRCGGRRRRSSHSNASGIGTYAKGVLLAQAAAIAVVYGFEGDTLDVLMWCSYTAPMASSKVARKKEVCKLSSIEMVICVEGEVLATEFYKSNIHVERDSPKVLESAHGHTTGGAPVNIDVVFRAGKWILRPGSDGLADFDGGFAFPDRAFDEN